MPRAPSKYAPEEQRRLYVERMGQYIGMRNARWLDRNTGPDGVIPPGIRELANVWEADTFLAHWCVRHGLLDRSLVPEGGIKFAQIGRLTSLVYFESERRRGEVGRALSWWLDCREHEQQEVIDRALVRAG